MAFQNKRGGKVLLTDVAQPKDCTWESLTNAVDTALQLEKDLEQSALDLHATSAENEDHVLGDFLKSNLLDERIKLAWHLTNVTRCGPGLGEYLAQKRKL